MKRSNWMFIGAGLLVAVLLVFLVAPHASSNPDGLEKVAADKGLDVGAKASATADSPLADYAVDGDDSGLSTGVAGLIGVVVTFGLGMGLFAVLRRRSPATPAEQVA